MPELRGVRFVPDDIQKPLKPAYNHGVAGGKARVRNGKRDKKGKFIK